MAGIIEVRISKEGKINIEVSGIQDASCTQLTKVLEDALGGDVERQTKPEYYNVLDDMQIKLMEGEN